MEQFKTWEEMSVLEQMACTYWDMYKDAHGVRPRGIDTSKWTEEDFLKEFDYLEGVIGTVIESELKAEKAAAVQFEQRVGEMIALGAKTREAALNWIMEADGANGDWDYLCFTNGLAYGYFNKQEA